MKPDITSIILLATLLTSLLVPGCSGILLAGTLSGTIVKQAVAETPYLVQSLANNFMAKNPGVKIVDYINEVGDPIETVSGGVVDIGAISYQITHPGKRRVFSDYLFAREGVAVIVNQEQPVEKLTMSQVTDIFSGKIYNWKQVGGNYEPITVYVKEGPLVHEESNLPTARSSSSSTQALILKDNLIPTNSIKKSTNESMLIGVGYDPISIGFVPFGFVRGGVKAVVIDGVEPTEENVRNQRYPLVFEMYFITRGPAKEPCRSFIDYCLSDEGQEITRLSGYNLIR